MSRPLTRSIPTGRPATGLIPALPGGPRPRGATIVNVALLAVLVLFGLAWPYLGTTSFVISLTTTILAAAMLASSVNFLTGLGGMTSLGHGAIAGASAYGAGWASKQGWDPGLQVVVALAVTLAASFVFGVLSMRTSGIYFLMVTLAVGMLIYGLAFRMSTITGGENGISNVSRPEFVGPYWAYYYFVFALFIVTTAVLWVVSRSPFGASLRGIRDSESRMRSLGYNIAGYKLGAFMISGTVAGLAGLLAVWHTHFVSPTSAGIERSILVLIMVILGGVGTLLGPLIGATIVVLVENVLSSHVDRWPTVLGIIFVIVILFARAGIAGSIAKLVRRIRRPAGRPRESDPDPGGSQRPGDNTP